MHFLLRSLLIVALLGAVPTWAGAADDVIDAIEQARKAYQSGDLTEAKQQLDLASQLIGQKNAEGFAKLLPAALPGWTAEKAESHAMGSTVLGGASTASRTYKNQKGDTVDISITGDSAMLMQFATMLNNPALAGAMGKLIKVGGQRAIQNQDGDVMLVIANKFVINVQGSGDPQSKLAYANAIDLAKLSKM
jgi:hypothetical protein